MSGKKGKKTPSNQIAFNKRARFEYFIEETLEAGIVLLGWEVKSIRAGQIQFADSYVLLRDREAFLFGCHMTPLTSTASHIKTDPYRNRKLLLHKQELSRLIGAVERKGYALVPVSLYWKDSLIKMSIGLAKGKKMHDKRTVEKDRDWERQKARILKHG